MISLWLDVLRQSLRNFGFTTKYRGEHRDTPCTPLPQHAYHLPTANMHILLLTALLDVVKPTIACMLRLSEAPQEAHINIEGHFILSTTSNKVKSCPKLWWEASFLRQSVWTGRGLLILNLSPRITKLYHYPPWPHISLVSNYIWLSLKFIK